MNTKNYKIYKTVGLAFVVVLFCFNPIRLILTDNYYYSGSMLDSILSISIVVFPIAGGFLLNLVMPAAIGGWSTNRRDSLFIILPLVSMVSSFIMVIPMSQEFNTKINSFKSLYEKETTKIIQQSLAASEVVWSDSVQLETPYIILWNKTSKSGELPRDSGALTLSGGWERTVFGQEIHRDIIDRHTPLSELPEFKCASAFIIVYSQEESGRMIKLINGSVPEVLWYAEVYADNLDKKVRMKLPERIYGSRAKKPIKKLGGVSYSVSRLVGEKPTEFKIEKYIKSLVKR